MVSTRKKSQSNRILSHLDDFDQEIIIGNTAGGRQQNFVVIEGTVDQEFTVNKTNNNLTIKENFLNVNTLQRCFNESIDREMGIIVDTVEDRN